MSRVGLTEDVLVEQPALRLLSGLGWGVASGFEEVLGSGGTLGRDSQSEPVLGYRLRDSLRVLNPGLPVAGVGCGCGAVGWGSVGDGPGSG